jgi:hypothetical protein
MATGTVLEINNILEPDELVDEIVNMYQGFDNGRQGWIKMVKEIREYLFSTDTSTTSGSHLPWKNRTVIPKLTQIRDNLHANYMAALFPNDNWLKWEGHSQESSIKDKQMAIEAYMENKTRTSNFADTVSELLYDYIDSGNATGEVIYIRETAVDEETQQEYVVYQGPVLRRISPYDIVFNPTAISFDKTPKIVRYIKTLGDLAWDVKHRPDLQYDAQVFDDIVKTRQAVAGYKPADVNKARGLTVDGFSSLSEYYGSSYVEILEFDGNIYDTTTGELLENHLITIVDRRKILRKIRNPNWLGKSNRVHVGWRKRSDNLYAQGPLDLLIGMQYRMNHLENLKADVFDMIAHPVQKIRGDVEEYEYAPGEKIYCAEDADVTFMHPDTTALNADLQIRDIEQKMEDFAGAPRQAMGIRTPGEKTAFEVQTLDTYASRIFQEKISQFERLFLEPVLNLMLESARRNLTGSDVISVMDSDLGSQTFATITRDDIAASGKLRPIGSRHFAATQQLLQSLMQALNSPLSQDPTVISHVSGKRLARLVFEELPGLRKFALVQDNVRLFETAEIQRLSQRLQENVEVEGQLPVPGEGEQPAPEEVEEGPVA